MKGSIKASRQDPCGENSPVSSWDADKGRDQSRVPGRQLGEPWLPQRQKGEEAPCVCRSAIILGVGNCHKRGGNKREGKVYTVNSHREVTMFPSARSAMLGSRWLLNEVT